MLSWILDQAFPPSRATPLVTVLDGRPRTLAFLSTIHRAPVWTLGVTGFGQSGSLEDVYRYHGIDADSTVAAAYDLIEWSTRCGGPGDRLRSDQSEVCGDPDWKR